MKRGRKSCEARAPHQPPFKDLRSHEQPCIHPEKRRQFPNVRLAQFRFEVRNFLHRLLHQSPSTPYHAAMILAFAPHPDDLEFGCGPILFQEAARGIAVHCIITSYGEAGSHGSPAIREAEAHAAAKILGTSLEFAPLASDAHLAPSPAHAMQIAAHIRTHKPQVLLAPTLVENQHPDHVALAKIVRDAARLARYAGLAELKHLPPHAVSAMLNYAITPDAEPRDIVPLLIDISAKETLAAWTAAIVAHASQLQTRNYLDLALTRAHLHGLRAGVSHALPVYFNDPLLLPNLESIGHSARQF